MLMFPGGLCRLRGGWVAAEGEREQEACRGPESEGMELGAEIPECGPRGARFQREEAR